MAADALVNRSLRGVDLSKPHPLQFERIGYFILDPDSTPDKVRLSHSQSTHVPFHCPLHSLSSTGQSP